MYTLAPPLLRTSAALYAARTYMHRTALEPLRSHTSTPARPAHRPLFAGWRGGGAERQGCAERQAETHSTPPRCRNNCGRVPTSVENANKKKNVHIYAHTCIYIHRHLTTEAYTIAPKRELDVLRAISPAGSHLERQDTHIPAYQVQQPTIEHTAMQRCANMLHRR